MPSIHTQGLQDRCARGTLQLLAWTLAWVGTMILVDKAVLYGWTTSIAVLITGVGQIRYR